MVLTQARLVELARGLGVSIPVSGRKETQISRLLEAARLPLPALLGLAAYGWSDIVVQPYCPPRPDDRAGQAALSLFEDTIIDRLFALNAERAEEEVAAASRPSPTSKPTSKAKKPKQKATAAQTSLLDEDS